MQSNKLIGMRLVSGLLNSTQRNSHRTCIHGHPSVRYDINFLLSHLKPLAKSNQNVQGLRRSLVGLLHVLYIGLLPDSVASSHCASSCIIVGQTLDQCPSSWAYMIDLALLHSLWQILYQNFFFLHQKFLINLFCAFSRHHCVASDS